MNQGVIQVLVVDDSAFMRKALRSMLESSPRIQVIGTSFSAEDALEKVQELHPDVVTVDLYMAGIGGVGFVREQMRRHPLAVVVCSSASEGGSEVVEAMEAGAIEFVRKPTAQALDHVMDMRASLVSAVLAAAEVSFEKLAWVSQDGANAGRSQAAAPALPWKPGRLARAVLIGVSTGGPRALRSLLPQLPEGFPAAVAVALHMPPGFTRPLAERLNQICKLEVVESSEGIEMRPGRIILAQAGYNTVLEDIGNGRVVARLAVPGPETLYCPSVNDLFRSGAEVYGSGALGVVMTGMGDDGTTGAAWIKAAGGRVIVEDQSSSVVYGMPRSVVEAGLADRIISLEELSGAILEEII